MSLHQLNDYEYYTLTEMIHIYRDGKNKRLKNIFKKLLKIVDKKRNLLL